ncbi:hypothetical protein [Aquibacillus sediminis]|uniref:hypothetical protein n=1 Tax=Aquibacillus sediminis TaxID=2574734 RepID=UPI001109EF61|nr:hypothetical protein [Aquibacillus sediminis]
MKLIYSSLIFILILGGCSSSTLHEAIQKTDRENVKILVQDDSDNIVVFLNEDYTGQPMMSLNTFSEKNGSYSYNFNGEYSKNVDLKGKYEFVRASQVGNSSNSVIWGGIFNYPDADIVTYSLSDEKGNTLYESSVGLNEENIVFQQLPHNIYEKSEEFHYKVLNNECNVIIEW